MQRPTPRWLPPAPWARPAFRPPFPPPPRNFPPPYFNYPQPWHPASGVHPGFVSSRTIDTEQLWLDSFRQTHCSPAKSFEDITVACNEPPLRLLRRRVANAYDLATQLKVAATELAAIEKRLESSQAKSNVEIAQLRVKREQLSATCEALKKQLEAMNVVSGLFSTEQLAELRAFAARINKKKAYRKRLKKRRRVDARIRRAIDIKILDKAETSEKCTTESLVETHKCQLGEKRLDLKPGPAEPIAANVATQKNRLFEQTLDPEALTMDALITVRRAWDSYLVHPNTRGASSIPPCFVPPPPAPSAHWAVYVCPANSRTPS